eukprot:7296760-Pyramimonas_sp.AAC.2
MGGGGLDSWDSTIRMWDVRTGECVRVITDHHADVYGIAAHPNRCVPPPARARHGHRALNNISKQIAKRRRVVRKLSDERRSRTHSTALRPRMSGWRSPRSPYK